MGTWLLTGGAGYIGSHVLRAMEAAGLGVVVLDDLSTGVAEKVPASVPLVRASVSDSAAVRETLERHGVEGVVHLAAKKAVDESVRRPLWYYEENVEGYRRLLAAMHETGVRRLVLSSTAAVYGEPDVDLVSEQTTPVPINPYGQTKLACEWMTEALTGCSDLRAVLLRYFNVAGAASPELGDPSVANLIPLALGALERGEAPVIFGDDYPTPDGTCIRDYIHVQDLAEAHVAATELAVPAGRPAVYNVSRGVGSSVREVIDVAQRVTDIDLPPRIAPRRAGDPPRLVGTADALARDVGWRARHDLDDMVVSAWQTRQGASTSSREG
jgi:UDP-glucose 4-epimerase